MKLMASRLGLVLAALIALAGYHDGSSADQSCDRTHQGEEGRHPSPQCDFPVMV
jgi:hypothetical protein